MIRVLKSSMPGLLVLICFSWLQAQAVAAELRIAQGWPHLQQHGRAEVQRQQQELQARYARLTAAEAETLLALELALQSADHHQYQQHHQMLQQALVQHQQLLQKVADGWLRTDWLHERWVRLAANAKTEAERQLFLRIFAEQFQSEPDLPAGLVRAFAYALHQLQQQLYRDNQRWLKQHIAEHGWFDISRTSADASQAAWLMIQHADWDVPWQQQMLQLLQAKVAAGEFQPDYYAYLADRIAVNTHQPQLYATQGACDLTTGRWQPHRVMQPEQLAARRQQAGLEPFAQYQQKFRCKKALSAGQQR